MRAAACRAWIDLFARERFVFLTGDLGFGALEPLREAIGDRFINAGLAEQSMVSVAAGLASEGVPVWVYSIAPFCYARPFEQIRNDVCLQSLPVKLVGNGGGYAYGSMGPSHHALEDYGTLLSLAGMRAFVPAFAADVAAVVERVAETPSPCYLRLGRCEQPPGVTPPPYAAWRRLSRGPGAVALIVGPLAGGLLAALEAVEPELRPELWSVAELPLEDDGVPAAFLETLAERGRLLVAEEHVAQGGVGAALAHLLARRGVAVRTFEHVHARGYPSGGYGSQAFHRRECGLDATALADRLAALGEAR